MSESASGTHAPGSGQSTPGTCLVAFDPVWRLVCVWVQEASRTPRGALLCRTVGMQRSEESRYVLGISFANGRASWKRTGFLVSESILTSFLGFRTTGITATGGYLLDNPCNVLPQYCNYKMSFCSLTTKDAVEDQLVWHDDAQYKKIAEQSSHFPAFACSLLHNRCVFKQFLNITTRETCHERSYQWQEWI